MLHHSIVVVAIIAIVRSGPFAHGSLPDTTPLRTCSAARSMFPTVAKGPLATGGRQCPDVLDYVPKYHADNVCDRRNFNTFRHRLTRGYKYRALKPIGASKVADTKTVYCPQNDDNMEDLRYSSPTTKYTLTGFTNLWLVENTASTPIIVIWINPNNGREYSANNGRISPPNRDPNAYIQPGQYKFFLTSEGHVFHVRSILEDGYTMGDVLLQYRQGLVPITNRLGPPDLYCDPNEPDIEPIVAMQRDPDYARTAPDPTPMCNVMDIGFRNHVGCPLNGYYVGKHHYSNETAATGQPSNERFQFHLGINSLPPDFVWDWTSQTKWEGTYVGHHFAFRLAKDPSILVDRVSIQPTYVPDCPIRKEKDKAKTEAVVNPIGILHYIPLNDTKTATLTAANATTTTSTQQQAAPMLKFNDTTFAPTNHFFSASLLTH